MVLSSGLLEAAFLICDVLKQFQQGFVAEYKKVNLSLCRLICNMHPHAAVFKV